MITRSLFKDLSVCVLCYATVTPKEVHQPDGRCPHCGYTKYVGTNVVMTHTLPIRYVYAESSKFWVKSKTYLGFEIDWASVKPNPLTDSSPRDIFIGLFHRFVSEFHLKLISIDDLEKALMNLNPYNIDPNNSNYERNFYDNVIRSNIEQYKAGVRITLSFDYPNSILHRLDNIWQIPNPRL